MNEERLTELLPAYLGAQRWFPGAAPTRVDVHRLEVVRDDWPKLVRAVVQVDSEGIDPELSRFQVLIGLRRPWEQLEFLPAEHFAIGTVDVDGEEAVAYDALVDPDLALRVLPLVAAGEQAHHVRPMGAEQSNSSLVYDDRLALKVFRRLTPGGNPEVEITEALGRVGFTSVPVPVATWRDGDDDLAVLQPFLTGGAEGWALALASLRDLYAQGGDPAHAGGDFAAEANRLGEITARLHLALAEALGAERTSGTGWAAGMLSSPNLRGLDPERAERVRHVFERLSKLDDAGVAIRAHGDYHLGQVLRTDTGWYVLDFEGEPARPVAERRRPTSPYKDVTGMLRSFQYAAVVALHERDDSEEDALRWLGRSWEQRNREAFLHGYLATDGIEALLPGTENARRTVSDAFELDKALYELAYERAHRPDWVAIPELAIARLAAR